MTIHKPVLVAQIVELLAPQQGHIFVDGTLGGGGHSRIFWEKVQPNGKVVGFDRDPSAVEATRKTLPDDAILVAANYADIPELLPQMGIETVDSILLDLGLSSDQLAAEDRGFSFKTGGSLDLRFDQTAGEPATRLVNNLREKNLADLIYEFGEEKLSRRIARKICAVRHESPIKTAEQLADIVRSCVPRSRNHSIDPATRTFQALRIAVNHELKFLNETMRRIHKMLKPGGRIAVISFHSLEDRIVKTAFNQIEDLKVLTRKPLMADELEVASNPRSRSAKLRVAERI